MYTRIILLFIFFWGALGYAQDPLKTFLSSRSLDPDATAIYIYDLESDYVAASHNVDKPLTPASVMKCVTTAALFGAVPSNSQFNTRVYLSGSVSGDECKGIITVVGSGDPSLGDNRHGERDDFPTLIARALKEMGISDFKGEIRIDNSLFAGPSVPESWPETDRNQNYGAPCFAFNFEGNASGKKAVKNPDATFKSSLAQALKAEGIEFTPTSMPTQNADVDKRLLLTYRSPAMGDLMQSCMFRSDNLYAEAFLRLFGLRNGTDGSTTSSALAAMRYWDLANLPLSGVEIIDGSGLSRDNRLTARFLAEVLKKMSPHALYAAFFPLVGEEGTVRNFMKDTPLESYVALKTGSMNGIQSYAGYKLDEDFKPTHVIVVIANNLKDRAAFRTALSRYLNSILK